MECFLSLNPRRVVRGWNGGHRKSQEQSEGKHSVSKQQFTYGKRGDKHYIFAPNGSAVIRYWWVEFARLGTQREYNAEFVYGKERTICCVYGGITRAITKYLNGANNEAEFTNDLYSNHVLNRLRGMRIK